MKNHTVVLEAVPRTTTHTVVLEVSADHAVAEFQSQKTVLRVSATRCCELPDRGVREHLPRTDDHALEEERKQQTEKQLSAIQHCWGSRESRCPTMHEHSLSLIERVMSNLSGVELVQCL